MDVGLHESAWRWTGLRIPGHQGYVAAGDDHRHRRALDPGDLPREERGHARRPGGLRGELRALVEGWKPTSILLPVTSTGSTPSSSLAGPEGPREGRVPSRRRSTWESGTEAPAASPRGRPPTLGLDRDHAPSREGDCDARDEPAASDRDDDDVDLGRSSPISRPTVP